MLPGLVGFIKKTSVSRWVESLRRKLLTIMGLFDMEPKNLEKLAKSFAHSRRFRPMIHALLVRYGSLENAAACGVDWATEYNYDKAASTGVYYKALPMVRVGLVIPFLAFQPLSMGSVVRATVYDLPGLDTALSLPGLCVSPIYCQSAACVR